MLPFWAEHGGMEDSPLLLRRATERDHGVIVGLIDGAAEWLRTKNTDQWAQPWPSEEDLDRMGRQRFADRHRHDRPGRQPDLAQRDVAGPGGVCGPPRREPEPR